MVPRGSATRAGFGGALHRAKPAGAGQRRAEEHEEWPPADSRVIHPMM
jgi:hypothetical protein